ncbi:uncharacterized protein FYW47_010157 [Aplochiton taeniatus]
MGVLAGSRVFELSPAPSPAWRGVFCLPGDEGEINLSNLRPSITQAHSQTTTTTTSPTSTAAPSQGSTTPGGGRVCRVKERAQGVLEKPCILRPKKERRKEGKDTSEGEHAGTLKVVGTPPVRERKGVVKIREVGGKLCVVRTSYPSDFGSPVWRGESDSEVEVRTEPPTPSPVTSKVLRVQLSEEESRRAKMAAADPGFSSLPRGKVGTVTPKEFSLDTPVRVREGPSLLESGYASDLPLTSPETGGATPSQTDWGGITSSSSERLDSVVESPLSPLQQPASKSLLQILAVAAAVSWHALDFHTILY